METKQILKKKSEYWKKKLIDLSKRNNLVSYRFTKSKSIKITEPPIAQVLTDLYDEKNIFFAKTEKKELKDRLWRCSEEDEITERKLVSIYHKAKENFQELGINSSFVSLYALKYKDNKHSEDYLSAPLFLFPVNIERLNYTSKEEHRFEIISSSDDLRVNPALIEKLSNDFGITVPEFEGEIEPFIEKFKKVISGRDEWKITEDAYLDIFSYQKYIMYADLEEHGKLLAQSDLIKCYVGDKNALQDDIAESQRTEFENDVDGIDVLSADSSQKKAIELAKAGVTFVLQGPPGTGKSQTIANIIAALMEKKKKILFVSQKMAALNVVQKRLDEVGLGRYCLNLHNYKGNKKEIVNQLITELETSPVIKESVKRYSFNTYLENQDIINKYYNFLSKKHKPRNFSVYDIRGELAKLLDVDLITQELNECLEFTEERFSHSINTIEKLDHIRKNISNPLNSVYFNFKREKNTSIQREKLKTAIKELTSSSSFIDKLLFDLNQKSKIVISNIDFLNEFSKQHNEFKKIHKVPEYLCSKDFYDYQNLIKKLFETQTSIDESLNSLKKQVKEDFLEINIKKFKEIFENTNVLGRLFNKEYKEIKFELQKYAKGELKHKDWIHIFNIKEELDNSLKLHKKQCDSYPQLIKSIGENSNISNLTKLKEYTESLEGFFKWSKNLNEENQFNVIKYFFENESLLNEVQQFIKLVQGIQEFFDIDIFNNKKELSVIQKYISQLLEQKSKIDTILIFKHEFSGLTKEIQEFTYKYFEIGPKYNLKEVFLKSYFIQLLDKIIFNESIQAPKSEIDQFRNLDIEVRDIQRFKIMDSIEQDQPTFNYRSNGINEVSVLKREAEKKRRLKPIRDLLEAIPNLVFTLKPCFMMSPLSVSQYTNPSSMKFDVVIFDEASQIMPEDAVPCLLRANQAIVVGDTQQLPPTSFFMSRDDEDVEEEIEDLESFLSECGTRFRTKPLLWHYRSKNEHLIAFSNRYFYENRLITFPNAKESDGAGLDFRYVKNGVYDRGKSRKNRDEAKEIVKVYKEVKKNHPQKSVGIIAFSMAQENAIREAFVVANIDINGEIDSHSEDLFIKNLETVQGDERDIIILSIGYGKDSKGSLSYNFGPMNKEGGYKRLNVAVTRSRYKTIVVSSIDPKELDDTKLNSDGPKYLKAYLRYAKDKDFELFTEATEHSEFDSPFEESVYGVLKKEGFDVVGQVGCSGYRIDLAIKHPKNKGDYILGVECDGAQYHSSRFARDRDKVRQQVLEGLGWDIHRIWSDDWLNNREYEIELIKEKVKNLSRKKAITKNIVPEKFEEVESIKDFEEENLKDTYEHYEVAELSIRRADNFFDIYEDTIKKKMVQILEVESPVEREYLYKRIISSFGIQKLGKRITEQCDYLVRELSHEMNLFTNKETIAIDKIQDIYDVRISREEQRPFISIPKEELAGAIYNILKNTFSATKDTLVADVAKEIFHNHRTGDKIKAKIDEALKHLVRKNLVVEEKGKFKMSKLKQS
ncbi:DUF3320 domain-containing protein [Candidatus Pacearchaeota archaeon]|nr:DUF3320 domain-containing protein [Candidatus Pacearchaeota archaeon]